MYKLTKSIYKRLLTAVFLYISLSFSAQGQGLPSGLKSLLQKHNIPQSAVSLSIQAVDSENPLVAFNDNALRNPASVIKVLTTLAAVELLGPHFQWTTEYLYTGEIKDSVLTGDLYFKGSGDPFLTVDRLWLQLLSLRQRGIETIQGDLILDDTVFNLPVHDRAAFDGQAQRLYNVGPSGVLTNFSATRFVLQPQNGEILVFADPPLENLNISNQIKHANGKCKSKNGGWNYSLSGSPDNLTAKFTGTYRSRCGIHSVSRSVLPNEEYTYSLISSIWSQLGGSIKGIGRIGKTPENARFLVSHPSVPLADVITSINKFSNNVMSRQLLLTIGKELYDSPGTIETGITGIRSWLTANGIDASGWVMENGSGLSRKSRIDTRGLIRLLRHGWNSNFRPELLSSLSLSALDGTTRKRLKKSPVRGRARLKTGLINGVRSMAGFVHTRNNKYYAVAMMIESSKVSYWNGNQIQDAVLEWLYKQP